MQTRTCQLCGKEFETEGSSRKYCSSDCAYEARLLRGRAQSRAREAKRSERRRALTAAKKALKQAAKAALEAELVKLPKRERAIRKWGGVERYEAHLAYARRYHELRKAGMPTRRESVARLRGAQVEENVDDEARTVCARCGKPLSKVQIANHAAYCSKSCAALAREKGWRETGTKPLRGPAPAAKPVDRACAVCGSEIGDTPGDLCCLCSRAVDRENAAQAAQSEAPWLVLKTRYCHDCGRPCNGYRCPRCLRKWRDRHGVNLGDTFEESV